MPQTPASVLCNLMVFVPVKTPGPFVKKKYVFTVRIMHFFFTQ